MAASPAAPQSSIAPSTSFNDWDIDGWDDDQPVAEVAETDQEVAEEADNESVSEDNTELSTPVDELPTAEDDPEAAVAAEETAANPDQEQEEGSPEDSSAPSPATDDDILDEIAEAERECARCESIVDGLKSRLKEAKKEFEAAIVRLRKLVRGIEEDGDRPLLKQRASSEGEEEEEAGTELEDDTSSLAGEPDGELANETDPDQEEESESTTGKTITEQTGTPLRIRITKFDPDWPQLEVGMEFDVVERYHGDPDFVVIDNPVEDPDNAELILGPEECEVIAWGEQGHQTGPMTISSLSTPVQEDESWRTTSLRDELGLPPGICNLLEENPGKTIKTVGDISDWGNSGKDLTDIPKIGPAKVEQINNALDKFWAKWNARK